MSFVYPAFLWALGALSIPVIVHLFSFRRYKIIYFPNVSFLQEVKKESDSRTRIKHWLVLASRLLALAFIIFAFAQPVLNNKNPELKKGKKAVSIYIDNSFSMQSLQNDVSVLETAKAKAREIISAYAPDDDFQIMTNTLEGIQQRFVNREQANQIIDDIKPTPDWRKLSELITLQNQFLSQAEAPRRFGYILSDFQKSFADFEVVRKDTTIRRELIRLQGNYENNVSIDTCWLDKPILMKGEPVNVYVKVSNHGTETVTDGRLSAEQQGQVKALANYTIPAGTSVIDTLTLSNHTPGWNAYTLRIQDYPIAFDDTYYITFETVDKIPVLLINDAQSNTYLTALFSQSQRFNLTQSPLTAIKYDMLEHYRLIVLNEPGTISGGLTESLIKAVNAGANILVVPGSRSDKSVYNNLLGTLMKIQLADWKQTEWQTDAFNLQHPLFSDLFLSKPRTMSLPKGIGYFPVLISSGSQAQSIFNATAGQAMCLSANYGKGQVFFTAFPFNKELNDFAVNALFAPILFKMCMPHTFSERLAYLLGSSDIIVVPAVTTSHEQLLKLKNDKEELLPQQRVSGQQTQIMTTALNNTGIYSVTDGSNDSALKKIALNYNRSESDIACHTEDELESFATASGIRWFSVSEKTNLAQFISERADGIPLWKYCITFALAFLIIEILLLKFFR
jgi:hypothetical protein